MTEEQLLRLHTEGFNQALIQQDYSKLEEIYSEKYMLVRPDGSVLNKQQVLRDLRERGLKFNSIDMTDAVVRVFGSAGILTAECRAVSSRDSKESRTHFRLVAMYALEGDTVRLVHFQSTNLS
jgi:Domain of unknown function (DUF4440)